MTGIHNGNEIHEVFQMQKHQGTLVAIKAPKPKQPICLQNSFRFFPGRYKMRRIFTKGKHTAGDAERDEIALEIHTAGSPHQPFKSQQDLDREGGVTFHSDPQ